MQIHGGWLKPLAETRLEDEAPARTFRAYSSPAYITQEIPDEMDKKIAMYVS